MGGGVAEELTVVIANAATIVNARMSAALGLARYSTSSHAMPLAAKIAGRRPSRGASAKLLQKRLAALGVDYVAFCPGAAEGYIYAAAAPEGLAAALARGDVPEFLERIPLEGTTLAVYRAMH